MYNLAKKKELLKNINITDIVILIIILFISFILPLIFKKQNRISDIASRVIDNVYFKTLLLLLIAFISKINIRISLFTLILVLTTIDTANKYKFDNNINLTLQKSQNNIKQLKQKIKKNNKISPRMKSAKISSIKVLSPKIPSKTSSKNSPKAQSIKEQYEPKNLNTNYSSYDNFGLLL